MYSTKNLVYLFTIKSCRNRLFPVSRLSSYTKYAEHKILERIRNVGISAHIDSGKTTLTERVLFYTGRIDRMHEVRGKDNVGAVMDSMELERQRGITIQSAATYTLWNEHNINIIDTPGHVDFTVEVERALRVLDGAVLVLCAVGGVQCQTTTVCRQMARYNVPCVAFINKLDRAGADYQRVVTEIRTKLKHNAALVHLPVYEGQDVVSIIDVISMKAFEFNGICGEVVTQIPLPANMQDQAEAARLELIEQVANVDDHLATLFLDEAAISDEVLRCAIRNSTIGRKFTPICAGSALKNKGVQLLLDSIIDFLPNPGQIQNVAFDESKRSEENKSTKILLNSERSNEHPFICLAFKLEAGKFGQLTYMRCYQGCLSKNESIHNTRTGKRVRISRLVRMNSDKMEDVDKVYSGDIFAVFGVECASGDSFVTDPRIKYSMESIYIPDPVISMSIKPTNSKLVENFGKAISRFTKEDPTFKVFYDSEMKESIAAGMGELHLEIYAQRIEREYGCPVQLSKPRVAFRETLISPFEFDYLHKKQTGGAGQFARVIGVMEPLSIYENTKLVFKDETVGTNVPRQYVPGVRAGFLKSCQRGYLTGHQVSGIKFRLIDGDNHCVDSSEFAFSQAAEGAVRQVFEQGNWHVIEPIMSVEVSGPCDFQSAVFSQMGRLRGHVLSQQIVGDWFTFYVEVPLSQMFGYSTTLRSHTQGKGEFSMEFVRYSPAPAEVQQQLIEEYTKQTSAGATQKSQKSRKRNM